MRQMIALTAIAALLAGCALTEAAQPGNPSGGLPPPGEDTCDAGRFAGLVGQPRQEAEAAALPASYRIIGPGDAVTMDFNPARLNILLDGGGIVTRLSCG